MIVKDSVQVDEVHHAEYYNWCTEETLDSLYRMPVINFVVDNDLIVLLEYVSLGWKILFKAWAFKHALLCHDLMIFTLNAVNLSSSRSLSHFVPKTPRSFANVQFLLDASSVTLGIRFNSLSLGSILLQQHEF